ncbi:MAG TPA: nucleoside deaminase [Candidatus Krumholzibacteria bacterium]|nr:nucleoside deaminase [Candidatus Krumholzibacteria bacterium]HPD72496.1 nucleoside deaminase [Candidatus Krumholzibacteria bacterium]HRY40572.1 nucleoside deaminase [Candidatus Krumholzibacteria bacterium]
MDPERRRFIEETLRLAEANVSEGRGGPFGAIVVKGGEIIARGTNLVTATGDPTAHAEVVAIREACRVLGTFQLAGCDVYASCEPCPMCLGAVYWARPDRLFFAGTRADAAAAGFDDSLIYDEIPLPPAARSLPTEQVTHADRLRPFAAWNARADRVDY